MNTTRITVVAATLTVALSLHAQNMVEYSTLSTKSITVPSTTQPTSRSVASKANTLNTGVASDAGKIRASDIKIVPGKSQPVAKPTPPAVFILNNGDRLESSHYVLTVDSLRLQQGETQRTIPMSAVNQDATVAANQQRGIALTIPKNKSEIMLSF
jgi:hypothetical protein